MTYIIYVDAEVTADGRLIADVPNAGLEPGKVKIAIEVEEKFTVTHQPEIEFVPFDEDELEELRDGPRTGEQMVKQGFVGGWEHMEIEDSAAWVQAQREKARKRRGLDW